MRLVLRQVEHQLHRADDAVLVVDDEQGASAGRDVLGQPQNALAFSAESGCMKLTEAPPSTQSISSSVRPRISASVTLLRRRTGAGGIAASLSLLIAITPLPRRRPARARRTVGRRGRPLRHQPGAEGRGDQREHRTGGEGELVAAIHGGDLGGAAARVGRAGLGRGEAREHREAERAAHHERGVDDARGEARVALVDAAHRREQQRIEGDAGAEAEQQHARQHVDDEAAVDRRAREERQAERGAGEPADEGPADAERLTTQAEMPSEHIAMITLPGRKARPTCIGD